MTYFCSIGSQILYIFETHGIGQTPSSLERYLVANVLPCEQINAKHYVYVSAWHVSVPCLEHFVSESTNSSAIAERPRCRVR